MEAVNMAFTLGLALGLRPLDRVQINNAREIAAMTLDVRQGRPNADLPFWFFQRVREDGRVEVRSPSGYATSVDAMDVCDILRGEPVLVRAMPRSVFIERLKTAGGPQSHQAGDECFAQAYVLNVTKDKWGRVDMVSVLFVDENLNAGGPWNAPIHASDKEMWASRANRTWMPVMGKGRSNASYSADKGVDTARDLARDAAKSFIRYATGGNAQAASILAQSGAGTLTRLQLNKLASLHPVRI